MADSRSSTRPRRGRRHREVRGPDRQPTPRSAPLVADGDATIDGFCIYGPDRDDADRGRAEVYADLRRSQPLGHRAGQRAHRRGRGRARRARQPRGPALGADAATTGARRSTSAGASRSTAASVTSRGCPAPDGHDVRRCASPPRGRGRVPEGDTVWLAGQHLNEALAGRVARAHRLPGPGAGHHRPVRAVGPRGRLARQAPAVTRGVRRRATAHACTRTSGWTAPGTSTGPGERWRGGPEHEVRVVLEVPTTSPSATDSPSSSSLPTAEESRVVGHLGPDLLGPDWDTAARDEAVRRLAADPDREIGLALLDQRNLAGLGNLYRLEVLFLRGISPWTHVRRRRPRRRGDAGAPSALGQPRDGVTRSRRATRVAASSTTSSSAPAGPAGAAAPPSRWAEQGEPPYERLTYWCPTCQPLSLLS